MSYLVIYSDLTRWTGEDFCQSSKKGILIVLEMSDNRVIKYHSGNDTYQFNGCKRDGVLVDDQTMKKAEELALVVMDAYNIH